MPAVPSAAQRMNTDHGARRGETAGPSRSALAALAALDARSVRGIACVVARIRLAARAARRDNGNGIARGKGHLERVVELLIERVGSLLHQSTVRQIVLSGQRHKC